MHTRISNLPNSPTIWSTIPFTWFSSVTLQAIVLTFPPASATISSAAFVSLSKDLEQITTLAPSKERRQATALPNPWLAAVIRAILSFIPRSIFSSYNCAFTQSDNLFTASANCSFVANEKLILIWFLAGFSP